ncbi:NAC domain-containing protein 76 [Linum perenne]
MEQTQQQQSQIPDFKLLPGFRFTPTDEQLAGFYLYNHIFGVSLQNISFCALSFCDLFGSEEPWEIWAKAQPTRLGLSTGDVYLITKVKKATTANGNGSRFGRGVGTTGGRWHESGKFPFKVTRESQELDGVRRKFSYQNTKSTEHMCWIMYEYAVSFDGGNTFSEDVICMLRNNGSSLFPEPSSGKKRKFEGCTGSSSLPSKVPKVSATSALLLVPDSCDKDVQPIAPTIQDEASGQTGHQLVHSDGFLLHPQVETSSTVAMQQVPSDLSFDSFLSNININSELQILTYQEQVPTLSTHIDDHYVFDGVFIDDKLAHSTWALIEDEAGHKGVQLEQEVEPPVKTVEHVPSPDSALNPVSFEYALSSDWLPDDDFFNCDPNPSCVPCSVGTNLIDESDDVLLYNSYPVQTGHQLVHSDGFLLHPQVENSSTAAMQQVPSYLSFDSFLSNTNINSELQIATYQEQVPTLSTHIDDRYVSDGVFIDDKLAHSTWALIEDEVGHKGVQLEQEVEPPVKTVEHVPSPDSALNSFSFEYALSSDWLPDDDFFNCDPNPSCVPCSVGVSVRCMMSGLLMSDEDAARRTVGFLDMPAVQFSDVSEVDDPGCLTLSFIARENSSVFGKKVFEEDDDDEDDSGNEEVADVFNSCWLLVGVSRSLVNPDEEDEVGRGWEVENELAGVASIARKLEP